MLRALGCQERVRGVWEWGGHISPAKPYKVRESQQGVGQGRKVDQQLQGSLAQNLC